MIILIAIFIFILGVVLYDVTQKKHAILRNFPFVGHFRYWLEMVGPELRQYIVTGNNEERPFSRDQRRWVYASSKKQNEYFGFGSDDEMELTENYTIIKPSVFPYAPADEHFFTKENWPAPCAKVMGQARNRKKPFRPTSVVNISGMSFGALSGNAISALNQGAKLANCWHNSGEGGISEFHQKGGDLIYQLGTGYFGCRDEKGRFCIERFKDLVAANPVRGVEIKLSQGAKPGMGGLLPAEKVDHKIAKARGIPIGIDCHSPSRHSEFRNEDELLDFVEKLADVSGLPIGIKSAVGDLTFWKNLADLMCKTQRGVDFITIDGGEGGTGAAPLVFQDHVALPFKIAFSRVYKEFALRDLHEKIVFNGSGKLGFPENSIFAFALGCDVISVAREAMLAIGCIQAQRCHTNHCPAGVATQNPWLARGLDPHLKSIRAANYLINLRKEILRVSWSCGFSHPGLLTMDHVEVIGGRFEGKDIKSIFQYNDGWGLPSKNDRKTIHELMENLSPESNQGQTTKWRNAQ